MHKKRAYVVAAGHFCVDIIPDIRERLTFREHFRPGSIINTQGLKFSLGGAVSNTGLALHRLGIPVHLVGKTGTDDLGRMMHSMVEEHGKGLTRYMIIDPKAQSSYSIVLSLPGSDRLFLHFPGANDTFRAIDVPESCFEEAAVLHFGYPTAMKCMFANKGSELKTLFMRAKKQGVITSLDLSVPDPASDAGRANWHQILSDILPYTDLFFPSLEEILFMLRRDAFDSLMSEKGLDMKAITLSLVQELAADLLQMGCRVVTLKLGESGIYLRSSPDSRAWHPFFNETWKSRELWTSCFDVEVAGTTGAGDTSIAGFLAALLRNRDPEAVLNFSAATGACCVEQPDATSGIPSWEDLESRLNTGWMKYPVFNIFSQFKPVGTIWSGPMDQRSI